MAGQKTLSIFDYESAKGVMELKNKNIFITGISGFVGSHMAKHLLNEGANVFGLVRRRADGSIPQNIKYLGIDSEIALLAPTFSKFSGIGQ